MAPDKLAPSDPRATHHTVEVRGKTYHYLLAQLDDGQGRHRPAGARLPGSLAGLALPGADAHGPGLQVIVPDMLGYGQTDCPDDLDQFSLKSMSADMAELVAHVVPGERIFLGGHDWGGALVWRMGLWNPGLFRAIFSVCTPYLPPFAEYVDVARLGQLRPNFRYQQFLAGPDVPREVATEDKIRGLLNGMYGGRGPAGEMAFNTEQGVLFENLLKVGKSPLVADDEMDFYVAEFARKGLRGPTNWYRTARSTTTTSSSWPPTPRASPCPCNDYHGLRRQGPAAQHG